MEVLWKRVNRALVIIGVLLAALQSVFNDDSTTFEGISYSLAIALALLWCYALFHFVKDSTESLHKPVFYAGALFPAYKFVPGKNSVAPHHSPLMAWCIGLVLMLVWGFYMNTSITPKWFGAVVTIGIELVVLMSAMYLRSLTLDAFKNTGEFITVAIAKTAWIETKR